MTDSIYSSTRAIGPSTALGATKTGRTQNDASHGLFLSGQPDSGFQDLFGEVREDVVGQMSKDFSRGSQGGDTSKTMEVNTLKPSNSESSMFSNRQLMGLDDASVDRELMADNSLSTVLKLTAKGTAYDVWNLLTGGFVKRHDERIEKFSRGEISEKDYHTGTVIDAGVSIGSQFVGGAVSGKVAGRLGGKIAGTVAGEFAAGSSEAAIQQTGQVLMNQATDGKLGDAAVDVGEVLLSGGVSAITAGTLHGVGKKLASKSGVQNHPPLTFSGGSPTLSKDSFSPGVVNQRSTEFYFLYGDNPLRGTLSNVDARKWYLRQEANIPNLLDTKQPLSTQARQAFDLRNQFRSEARELMQDRITSDRLIREEANLDWDDLLIHTENKLIKRGVSNPTDDQIYNEIINSSQRSRQKVNRALGL